MDCSLTDFGRELGWRAGAGVCARRRSNFLLFRQKKVTKEKATPSLRPLRFATGQTCVGAIAGCAVELTTRFQHSVQTATASQSTKQARFDAPAHPAITPPQAQPAGGENRHGPSRCSALVSRRAAPARCGPSAAMARVVGSLLAVPRSAGRGAAGVPKDTPASWSDSLRLFERSAQREASSAARPAPEHRRLPVAQRRDTDSRVALSLVTFFRRRERKLLARRGELPASAFTTSIQNASKLIAASAY